MPLIISVPGYEENYGSISETITELIDLYPTLAELTGLSPHQPSILQGESLAGYLSGKENSNDNKSFAYTVSYNGKDGSLRTDQYRYTRWGEGMNKNNEELYDHKNDPEENRNLVHEPTQAKILAEMREQFEVIKRKAKREINNEN